MPTVARHRCDRFRRPPSCRHAAVRAAGKSGRWYAAMIPQLAELGCSLVRGRPWRRAGARDAGRRRDCGRPCRRRRACGGRRNLLRAVNAHGSARIVAAASRQPGCRLVAGVLAGGTAAGDLALCREQGRRRGRGTALARTPCRSSSCARRRSTAQATGRHCRCCAALAGACSFIRTAMDGTVLPALRQGSRPASCAPCLRTRHRAGTILEPDDGRAGGYAWADLATVARAAAGAQGAADRIRRRRLLPWRHGSPNGMAEVSPSHQSCRAARSRSFTIATG